MMIEGTLFETNSGRNGLIGGCIRRAQEFERRNYASLPQVITQRHAHFGAKSVGQLVSMNA
jgi:hypothetical protein